MKILSLFDGVACARVALNKAGITVEKYIASEIEKVPSSIVARNWNDAIHVGDVTKLKGKAVMKLAGGIDLIIGGSPCQDLSIAKSKRQGLKGSRSALFYEFARLVKEIKPTYFILENVASMPKEARDEITKVMGVEPIMIDAALVSAQTRKRLFWTNIPGVTMPIEKGILLKDIIHEARGEKFELEKHIIKDGHLNWSTDENRLKKRYSQINGEKAITMMARQYANWNGQYISVRIGEIGKGGQGERIYSANAKAISLPASPGYSGTKVGIYLIDAELAKKIGKKKAYIRKLTPIECERLQGLPDNYTSQGIELVPFFETGRGISQNFKIIPVSDAKRYEATGNAFNSDVVAHILSFIPRNK